MSQNYKTLQELFDRLKGNPLTVSSGTVGNLIEHDTLLYRREVIEYLSSFSTDTPVTPEFYVELVRRFMKDLFDDLAEDLWRVGYYSGLWADNYRIACIVAYLDGDEFIDEKGDMFKELIQREIKTFNKNDNSAA